MTIMSSIAEATTSAATGMPRFEDGSINLQEVLRQLAEPVVNEVMSAEADQPCEAAGNSRNGYRERMLTTCVGTLTLRVPKPRTGSLFPGDVLERHQRVDRAVVATAAMGIERISKDQVSAICQSLDSEVEELSTRPPGDLPTPYLWLDATYVKCRRSGRVASTAVATAIGCDSEGWRHVLGAGVVDTESYDSWSAFLGRVRERGVRGVRLVTSDAHEGLRRAVEETFQGAAWQRCAVRLMRDRARAAARRPRAYSRRPSPTRRPTSTSRPATGSACAPTTCIQRQTTRTPPCPPASPRVALYPNISETGVTRLGGVTPSFTAMMLSATVMPMRRLVSYVADPA